MKTRKTKSKTLPIGEISQGTTQTLDVFDALVVAMSGVRMTAADRRDLERVAKVICLHESYHGDPLDEAISICEMYLPEWTYLGYHTSDGASFGVWADWDSIGAEQDQRGDMATSRGEADKNGCAYACETNDHGNTTMWAHRGGRTGRWHEVWSTV